MKLLSLFSLIAIFFLSSCSSNEGTTNITVFYDVDKDNAKYYVSKSIDDVKENSVSSKIYDEISHYTIAKQGVAAESLSEAFLNAKVYNSTYVIYPTVKEWRKVDESGKPFQANVLFEVGIYAVSSEKLINKTVLERECIFITPFGKPDDCISLDLWARRVIKR